MDAKGREFDEREEIIKKREEECQKLIDDKIKELEEKEKVLFDREEGLKEAEKQLKKVKEEQAENQKLEEAKLSQLKKEVEESEERCGEIIQDLAFKTDDSPNVKELINLTAKDVIDLKEEEDQLKTKIKNLDDAIPPKARINQEIKNIENELLEVTDEEEKQALEDHLTELKIERRRILDLYKERRTLKKELNLLVQVIEHKEI